MVHLLERRVNYRLAMVYGFDIHAGEGENSNIIVISLRKVVRNLDCMSIIIQLFISTCRCCSMCTHDNNN